MRDVALWSGGDILPLIRIMCQPTTTPFSSACDPETTLMILRPSNCTPMALGSKIMSRVPPWPAVLMMVSSLEKAS